MLTSIRGIVAASFSAGLAFAAAPAFAEEAPAAPIATVYGPVSEADVDRAIEEVSSESKIGAESGVTFSANVALTTDYRFRGVSLSGGDFAIQGGFDVSHSSGFYVGTWGSSIAGGDAYGDLELDVYGGWSGDLAEGVSFDIGLLYYMYPTEANADGIDDVVDYWEPYASIGYSLGPVEATLGAAYAWKQDSLGGDDNLYVYLDLGSSIPNTPISISAHLGYTDGVLAPPYLAGLTDDTGFDWSIGASTALGPFELAVSYIGVEGPSIDGFTDDAVVATLSASF